MMGSDVNLIFLFTPIATQGSDVQNTLIKLIYINVIWRTNMSNEVLKGHLKQLKSTIEKYEEAIDKVEIHCFEYSLTPDEYQQDIKDMESFRKMQLTERMKYLIKQLENE